MPSEERKGRVGTPEEGRSWSRRSRRGRAREGTMQYSEELGGQGADATPAKEEIQQQEISPVVRLHIMRIRQPLVCSIKSRQLWNPDGTACCSPGSSPPERLPHVICRDPLYATQSPAQQPFLFALEHVRTPLEEKAGRGGKDHPVRDGSRGFATSPQARCNDAHRVLRCSSDVATAPGEIALDEGKKKKGGVRIVGRCRDGKS